MNEIEKLKAEHARYGKALEKIRWENLTCTDAFHIADAALNPPTSPPVTLEVLLEGMRRFSKAHPKYRGHSINFYEDESGSIRDGVEDRVFSFSTLSQAVDWLTR